MNQGTAPKARRQGFFVAGTDTGVGKTRVAAALIRALVKQGLRVAAMKPVAAGACATDTGLRNADALALAAAANVEAPYEMVNPYCFAPAVSPHIAAREAGVIVEPDVVRRHFDLLAARADCVVVEGAGGWLAPIGERQTMADIAVALGLPVLLVVGLRLGCLSHALLTARAIREDGLPLAGWIGNHVDPAFERGSENVATLEQLLGCEPIALMPFEPGEPAQPELPEPAGVRLARALQTT